MKKFIGFLIIGVLFFVLGYFICYFQTRHLHVQDTARTLFNIAQNPKGALLGDDKSAGAGTTDKKSDGSSASAAAGGPGKDKPASTTGESSSDKGDGSKKEDGKTSGDRDEQNDQKLLGSLWVVKKERTGELANRTGVLYFDGTSPYGVPEEIKDELFASENMLYVPATDLGQNRRVQSNRKLSAGPNAHFWLQVGAFPSFLKAQKVGVYFLSKGYDVDLYQGQYSASGPVWYFVRFRQLAPQQEMMKQARVIRELENIVPSLVEYNTFDRRLR
ncbi:MAG: hypothetical protein WCG05_04140 [Alphaproteobacteria bacterium]